MKRCLVLCTCLLCFFLSSCQISSFLPRANEPRNSAIVSVLGIEGLQFDNVRVLAISQNRSEVEAVTLVAQEDSISHAIQKTRDEGAYTASYAHVEHLLLEENSAQEQLEKLLSMSFQNGEQSIESKLWLLREGEMQEMFTEHKDLANQLDSLKTGATAGTSLPVVNLRQVASRLFDDGTVLLPALRWENAELSFDSYAIYKEGADIVYLDDEVARCYAILRSDIFHWVEDVGTSKGRVAVSLQNKKVRVRPRFQEGTLTGISILCHVDASLPEEWEIDDDDNVREEIKTQLERQIQNTVERWQMHDLDAVDLRRKAGLSAPHQWTQIEEQWEDAFAGLDCRVGVEVNLKHFF